VTCPVKLNIMTSEQGEPAGPDMAIISAPVRWYASLEGKRALLAQLAGADLRVISEHLAERTGERLHHAEWTFTDDPELVKALGAVHDCARCQAGTDQALAFLREHPGREVAVGHLWWA
jgi:hypothetical protein